MTQSYRFEDLPARKVSHLSQEERKALPSLELKEVSHTHNILHLHDVGGKWTLMPERKSGSHTEARFYYNPDDGQPLSMASDVNRVYSHELFIQSLAYARRTVFDKPIEQMIKDAGFEFYMNLPHSPREPGVLYQKEGKNEFFHLRVECGFISLSAEKYDKEGSWALLNFAYLVDFEKDGEELFYPVEYPDFFEDLPKSLIGMCLEAGRIWECRPEAKPQKRRQPK